MPYNIVYHMSAKTQVILVQNHITSCGAGEGDVALEPRLLRFFSGFHKSLDAAIHILVASL